MKRNYVDGFVIPIKKSKVIQYKKMAKMGEKVWIKNGALDYFECVGDDLFVKWGMNFPKMCKLKKDETIIFSFITYKSKKHRDQVNKKVMKDLSLKLPEDMMPFDMKRFSSGGFKILNYQQIN